MALGCGLIGRSAVHSRSQGVGLVVPFYGMVFLEMVFLGCFRRTFYGLLVWLCGLFISSIPDDVIRSLLYVWML